MFWAAQQSAWQRELASAWLHRGWLAWSLWPISLVFGALAAFRRGWYRAGLGKIGHVPVPLIVVGNVVAGGTGKTPVVIALVQHLKARGVRVGVISRGYGRRSKDCRQVHPDSASSDVGDEPALIARASVVPVFVAQRRFDAASALLLAFPDTQIVICDDGLQHISLHRDLEICVFDDRGIGNGFLLPAGPLREPWPRAVDLVLHTGAHPAFAGFTAQRKLCQYATRFDSSQIALTELADLNRAGAKPLLALAAIAKPEDFFAMLRLQGLPLAATVALPDHYDFAGWKPNEYQGYCLICTEKDAVKLWSIEPDALAVALNLTLEPAFLEQLDVRLSRLMPAGSA